MSQNCPRCDFSLTARRPPKEGDTRTTFGTPMAYKNGEWKKTGETTKSPTKSPKAKSVDDTKKVVKKSKDADSKKAVKPTKKSKAAGDLDLNDRAAMIKHFYASPRKSILEDPPKFGVAKSPVIAESVVAYKYQHYEGEPIQTSFHDQSSDHDVSALEQIFEDKRFSKSGFSTYASSDWFDDPTHQDAEGRHKLPKVWEQHWRVKTDVGEVATTGWFKTREDERKGKVDPEFKKLLDSAPKYKGDCFRGISVVNAAKLFKAGEEFELDASSSASIDPNTAASFTDTHDRDNVLMVIRSKTAADTSVLNKEESEVVMRKGSKYRIKRVTEVDRNIKHRGNRHYDELRKLGIYKNLPGPMAKEPAKGEPGSGLNVRKGTLLVVVEEI